MSATLVIRHRVADYAKWQAAYDEAEPLRAKYGCTGKRVMRLSEDANDLLLTHDFPTVGQASGFIGDPALGESMQHAGVDGHPQLEIFTIG